MDIDGTRAVVFGGTSGIGLATVQALAAAGATVTAVSRHPEKARAEDLHQNVSTRACDVLDGGAVADLLAELAPYDILISAATGGSRAVGPFLSMDMAEFRGSFDKLWGYANVLRFGAEHLEAQGAIVLVSGSPARRAKPGQAAIAATGAAVESLVRTVAPEIAPRRINVVAPGLIDTPMFPWQGEARTSALAGATRANLIPRAGTPDEVAEAILFLVRNDFVTGTTIDVDGGWLLS